MEHFAFAIALFVLTAAMAAADGHGRRESIAAAAGALFGALVTIVLLPATALALAVALTIRVIAPVARLVIRALRARHHA